MHNKCTITYYHHISNDGIYVPWTFDMTIINTHPDNQVTVLAAMNYIKNNEFVTVNNDSWVTREAICQ